MTSSSNISCLSSSNAAPWIAAPSATTSSGCTRFEGSFSKNAATERCTRGIRVMPPTSTTSSTSSLPRRASCSVCLQISIERSIRSSQSVSSVCRVRTRCRCSDSFAPFEMMNGRLISVSFDCDSSHLAFSAASFSRCSAMRSCRRSIACSSLKPCTSQSMTRASKSSPPRNVSPAVAMTLNTPWLPISSTEMSKVPPPRSNTAMSFSLLVPNPYASAAAVGSLMMRSTSRPAI